MNKLDVRVQLSCHADCFRNVLLQRLMIASVHQQKLMRCSKFSRICQLFIPVNLRFRLVYRNFNAVVIPVCKQDARQLRSIRGFPHHLRICRLILSAGNFVVRSDWFDAPPEDNCLHACLLQYLRHLTCVSKRIREITNIPDCTVLFCFLHADLKIADTCLSARQELILQNIPRTGLDFALADAFFHLRTLLRTNFQIIIDCDDLSVEEKASKLRVVFRLIQNIVHQLNQFHAVCFKRLIPLSVPVGMGNNMYGCFHHDLFPFVSLQSGIKWFKIPFYLFDISYYKNQTIFCQVFYTSFLYDISSCHFLMSHLIWQ